MVFKVVRTIKGSHLDPEKYQEIGARFFLIDCETEDEIIAAAQDADAVQTLTQPYTRRVISQLKKCKLIEAVAAGYESIDIEAATEYGIYVTYAADYCKDEVAEHTMALILACARKVTRLDRAVREGKWDSLGKEGVRAIWSPMFRIKGKTLGIIGFGRIGREIFARAKGFGLRTIAFDPYTPATVFKELGVEAVALEELLEQSDYVSVNAALTQETRHLLGIEQFKKMKPTAYFINTSRAEIADKQALVIALEQGYIAGAGLDVVEGERMSLDNPLLRFENVTLTPHSSFYSEESSAELKQRAFEEVARMIRGERPLRSLNPEVEGNFIKRWGRILK